VPGLELENECVLDEVVDAKRSDLVIAEQHIDTMLASRVEVDVAKENLERARIDALRQPKGELVVCGKKSIRSPAA
jgi:hypothetical protein